MLFLKKKIISLIKKEELNENEDEEEKIEENNEGNDEKKEKNNIKDKSENGDDDYKEKLGIFYGYFNYKNLGIRILIDEKNEYNKIESKYERKEFYLEKFNILIFDAFNEISINQITKYIGYNRNNFLIIAILSVNNYY